MRLRPLYLIGRKYQSALLCAQEILQMWCQFGTCPDAQPDRCPGVAAQRSGDIGMFIGVFGGNEDIVHVAGAEGKVFKDAIH